MVPRRLMPIKNKINGFILTFYWYPVMRELAYACGTLGIPRILVPHEAIFFDESKYYVDVETGVDRPLADLILGWGALQARIFLARGFTTDRFVAVGAPKFDAHFDYRPELTRDVFFRLFSLDPARETILFAMQPMDSQTNDEGAARNAQRRALKDLLAYAQARGAQVIVRTPPSAIDVLSDSLKKSIKNSPLFAIDSSPCYVVSPEEVIFHCDVVVSVNSTMLFEALLMGRAAVSAKYLEFEQIWANVGIPGARDGTDLARFLDEAFANRGATLTEEARAWAAANLSCGQFDGRSAQRVAEMLEQVC
jgi:hypothetical protein